MIVKCFVVVATPIIPVLGFLIIYFWIALDISSTAVTTFIGRLIYGGCVIGPVLGLLLPYTESYPDVGNKS